MVLDKLFGREDIVGERIAIKTKDPVFKIKLRKREYIDRIHTKIKISEEKKETTYKEWTITITKSIKGIPQEAILTYKPELVGGVMEFKIGGIVKKFKDMTK